MRIGITIVLLALMSGICITDSFAAGIEKTAGLQPAGLLILHASVLYSDSQVRWEVTSYTIDENTGARSEQQVVFKDERDSVRILLLKAVGKYTFYKAVVYENALSDSVEFQVLNKGVADKYLFQNTAIPSRPIPVYVILPAKFSADSKFLMSMHGTGRNADDYANAWRTFANLNNYVIAAPEFSSSSWSTSAYNLGNMFTGTNGSGLLNPQEQWTFNMVQLIHTELVQKCGLKNQYYTMWGHSAGAQFVHRLALFCPDKFISMYIVADAGWYTAPDPGIIYPWGVKHDLLHLTENDLFALTEKNIVLMRGTADTLRDSNLNTDPLSDAQGLNRYERAGYFYSKAMQVNPDFEWPLIDVHGVAHEYDKMAVAAGDYIINGVVSTASADKDIIPEKFTLCNYPNPFNPETKIKFTIPAVETLHVYPAGGATSLRTVLKIYDLLGREVRTLINEDKTPGSYEIKFNGNDLAGGTYFCRLTIGSRSMTSKMILLK